MLTIPARPTGLDYDTTVPSPADATAATYLLHQVVRYDYPGPVQDLRQVLRLVPPAAHGDQRRTDHGITVRGPASALRETTDRFGNHVIEVVASTVERFVEFDVWAAVSRAGGDRIPSGAVPAGPHLRAFLRSTPRTRLGRAALQASPAGTAPAAGPPAAPHDDRRRRTEEICGWVHATMRYAPGATTVTTTAAEALQSRRGVCQDYAHVMLGLCRASGLAARYVSGHLLGEGGSHAWVEVLLPGADGVERWEGFDPTHDRPVSLDYITVGVGRDYADVAPMTGTYRGPHAGALTVTKRAHFTPAHQSA